MSESKEEKPTKTKFKFKCTMCGSCCDNRGPIPLTLQDIEYWSSKKIISNMFPYMKVLQSPMGITELVMDVLPNKNDDEKEESKDIKEEEKKEGENPENVKEGEENEKPDDGDEDGEKDEPGDDDRPSEESAKKEDEAPRGKCPMYNRETKKCLIWADRPLYCRAFPLGYDGMNYFIKMDDCPGINAVEDMDKELLKQMREDAKKEFEGKRLLGIVLPILQGIVMRTLQEEQMKFLSKLSPEQIEKLQQLQDILADAEKGEN
ncbi:MAG: YkgJ family cysteine cluster protein [Promethearchaeota archaeon]